MAKINDYYEKKQLMEKLAAELEKLEEDQALKGELEFENKVRDLMKEYNKSPKDVLQILAAIDPSIGGAKGEAASAWAEMGALREHHGSTKRSRRMPEIEATSLLREPWEHYESTMGAL